MEVNQEVEAQEVPATPVVGTSVHSPKLTVVVSNLTAQISAEILTKLFNFCGKIKNIEFFEEDDKKCAYIDFVVAKAVSTAILLNGTNLGETTLAVCKYGAKEAAPVVPLLPQEPEDSALSTFKAAGINFVTKEDLAKKRDDERDILAESMMKKASVFPPDALGVQSYEALSERGFTENQVERFRRTVRICNFPQSANDENVKVLLTNSGCLVYRVKLLDPKEEVLMNFDLQLTVAKEKKKSEEEIKEIEDKKKAFEAIKDNEEEVAKYFKENEVTTSVEVSDDGNDIMVDVVINALETKTYLIEFYNSHLVEKSQGLNGQTYYFKKLIVERSPYIIECEDDADLADSHTEKILSTAGTGHMYTLTTVAPTTRISRSPTPLAIRRQREALKAKGLPFDHLRKADKKDTPSRSSRRRSPSPRRRRSPSPRRRRSPSPRHRSRRSRTPRSRRSPSPRPKRSLSTSTSPSPPPRRKRSRTPKRSHRRSRSPRRRRSPSPRRSRNSSSKRSNRPSSPSPMRTLSSSASPERRRRRSRTPERRRHRSRSRDRKSRRSRDEDKDRRRHRSDRDRKHRDRDSEKEKEKEERSSKKEKEEKKEKEKKESIEIEEDTL